jgi:hypothetical protein
LALSWQKTDVDNQTVFGLAQRKRSKDSHPVPVRNSDMQALSFFNSSAVSCALFFASVRYHRSSFGAPHPDR